MNSPSPSGLRRGQQIFVPVLLAGAGLWGCASLDSRDSAGAAADLPVAAPKDPITALLEADGEGGFGGGSAAPSAEAFWGLPVATLEAVTGPPTLIRQEAGNEFRRYDLPGCRAFAVVIPAGGAVQKVWTGAVVAGAVAPPFDQCAAANGTGS